MSYIQDSLSKDEKIKKIFKLHWFEIFRLMIFIIVILFILLFFYGISVALELPGASLFENLMAIAMPLYVVYSIFYIKLLEQGVTNKRVILKRGIIGRDTQEMRLDAIETVEIKQSIMGRILGFGTIKITGRGISDLVFKNIDNPLEVKKEIESVQT